MRAGRKWTFFTAGIAALSFGLDAAAQKQAQPFPRQLHDLRPSWAGPDFRGPNAGIAPGLSAGANVGVVPPAPVRESVSLPVPGNSAAQVAPGRGGEMPENSNKGGGPGKDKGKPDSPGEHVQVVVEHGAGPARPMHEIPTCR